VNPAAFGDFTSMNRIGVKRAAVVLRPIDPLPREAKKKNHCPGRMANQMDGGIDQTFRSVSATFREPVGHIECEPSGN
jgi:hypothetical protein